MLIVYDEVKRQSNLVKHGLDFADLTIEFFESAAIFSAKAGRSLALGALNGQPIIAVILRLSAPKRYR